MCVFCSPTRMTSPAHTSPKIEGPFFSRCVYHGNRMVMITIRWIAVLSFASSHAAPLSSVLFASSYYYMQFLQKILHVFPHTRPQCPRFSSPTNYRSSLLLIKKMLDFTTPFDLTPTIYGLKTSLNIYGLESSRMI